MGVSKPWECVKCDAERYIDTYDEHGTPLHRYRLETQPAEKWEPSPESFRSDAEDVADDAYQRGLAEGIERARTVVLEQRCERDTPWDLACTTLAAKILALHAPSTGEKE